MTAETWGVLRQETTAARSAMAGRQVVIGHRGIAGSGQGLAGVAADITGPARDQHRLGHNKESRRGWRDGHITVSQPLMFHRLPASYRSAARSRGISRSQARSVLRS